MSDSAQEKMAHAFQAQQAQWSSIASKALESSIKLVELNLKITRETLENTTQSVQHLLAIKSPEEMFSMDQGMMQERLNTAMVYANEIGAIASAFATEINQVAQSSWTDSYEKISKLSDGVTKPAVAQNIFPNLGNAQQGYEQWMDAGKKMMESFGHNLSMPVAAAQPVKKAPVKTTTAIKSRARH